MANLIEILKKETETLKFGFGEASKKYYRLPYYIVNSNGKVEQHIEKMAKQAINHYESSIKKLAARRDTKTSL